MGWLGAILETDSEFHCGQYNCPGGSTGVAQGKQNSNYHGD